MTPAPHADNTVWADASLAAALVAVDPHGLAGVSLRARAGPVRDSWMEMLRALLPAHTPVRKMPLHVKDERLFGGLDLAATLKAGQPFVQRGMFAEADGGLLVLTSAERLPAEHVARVGTVLDRGEVVLERDGIGLKSPAQFGIVALDEGIEPDEKPHPALLDRLAFHVDLSHVSVRETCAPTIGATDVSTARRRLSAVHVDDQILAALASAALAFGITSVRSPVLAARAASACAALFGRREVHEEDAALAARLVFAGRATAMPATDDTKQPPEPPEQEQQTEQDTQDGDQLDHGGPLEDRLLSAIAAAIPPGLLAQILSAAPRGQTASSGRAGPSAKRAARGRPVGTLPGDPRGASRLSVIETLRAAAPWQRIRRRDTTAPGEQRRLDVRRDDFRIARLKHPTETTTIFAVDASGSSALHRLAEAKGAVEMLLSDCYVRRDQVALIAFRGDSAEVLLPPTRSLVLAKRRLAALPGGGGTPIAAALDACFGLACNVRRKGTIPTLVLLTDGQANIARDGTAGRARAQEDALQSARAIRAAEMSVLLIDTSPRPREAARTLADALNARYLPLPHASAAHISAAVRSAVSEPQDPAPADGTRMNRRMAAS